MNRMNNVSTGPTRQQMWDCATKCMEAQSACIATLNYCLDQGGKYSAVQLIRLLLDTAAVCQTTAESSRNETSLFRFSSTACAEICSLCALGCAKFSDDAQMRSCAEMCTRCAESCQQLQVLAAAA
jgi:hypothetical protein